jgi:hypothetical protein
MMSIEPRGLDLQGLLGVDRRGVLRSVHKSSDNEKSGNGEDEHAEGCLPKPQYKQSKDAYCRESGSAEYDTGPSEYGGTCD